MKRILMGFGFLMFLSLISCGDNQLTETKTLFKEINTNTLTGVEYGGLVLGDIDNDGDLDLIVYGASALSSKITKVYQNNGSGSFTEIHPNSIIGIEKGSLLLGDIDNDKDLDLVMCGYNKFDSSDITKIYTNNGTGSFSDTYNSNIMYLQDSKMTLGDIDNDGDLDLISTGVHLLNCYSKIYINNGSGSFTEINSGSLTGFALGSITLGDINKDNKLDLILTGKTNYTNNITVSKIYTNDGNGNFKEIYPESLPSFPFYGTVISGDIDNDGDLDLVMSGETNVNRKVSIIFQNDGSGHFTEIYPNSILGLSSGSLSLGDIDNSGSLDLIVSGNGNSKIYTNNGSGFFTEIFSNSLQSLYGSATVLGDIDKDGDLDLILSGYYNGLYYSKIYQNTTY